LWKKVAAFTRVSFIIGRLTGKSVEYHVIEDGLDTLLSAIASKSIFMLDICKDRSQLSSNLTWLDLCCYS